MPKKIIIANWKMNPETSVDALKLLLGINKNLPVLKNIEIVACPPFLYLEKLKKETKKIKLGAQNVFYEESGAFTGEISVPMLVSCSVKYVILGHSERRAMGENNDILNKKVKAVLKAGLIPVLCVGEKNRDENHEYLNLVKTQIEECLKGISKTLVSKIIIAYEPVWAIGKDAVREATPDEFLEMKIFIKKILSGIFGIKTEIPKIIYGGSVDEKSVSEFIKIGEADGFLIGRASLNIEKFIKIINNIENANN